MRYSVVSRLSRCSNSSCRSCMKWDGHRAGGFTAAQAGWCGEKGMGQQGGKAETEVRQTGRHAGKAGRGKDA
jgi:hypothetical protein